MAGDLRQRVLDYLAGHNTMTLATLGPEGPWAAGLFYVNDGLELYWLSEPDARHSTNLARDPSAAVTVHEDYRDWLEIKGVQSEGIAELVGPVEPSSRPVQLYLSKYTFLGDLSSAPQALAGALASTRLYRFRPSRVCFVDNSTGVGGREELDLRPAGGD